MDQQPALQDQQLPQKADPLAPASEAAARVAGLLATARDTTRSLLAEPLLAQWNAINFETMGGELRSYGLEDDYQQALTRSTKEAREILRQVELLENELGSLLIDLRRRRIAPSSALAEARRLEQGCEGLSTLVASLERHCRTLLDGQEALRARLSITALLPYAKRHKEIHADRVEKGYRFFLQVSGAGSGDLPTLADSQARATALEKRFKKLDFSGLPGLVVAILDHQRQVAVHAADQIKGFLEDFQAHPPAEFAALEELGAELERMRQAELAVLLNRLPELTFALGTICSDLYFRGKSLRQIHLLPVFLGHLDALHRTLATRLPEDLEQQIARGGSPLNPATVANELTSEFFLGLRGLFRTMKLFLQALRGQPAINVAALQQSIIDTLSTCTIYYGNRQMDVARLRAFLEERLAAYHRPFPFENLFRFLKRAIFLYGDRVEKYVLTYPVSEIQGPEPSEGGQMPMGRLISKIEVWSEHFMIH